MNWFTRKWHTLVFYWYGDAKKIGLAKADPTLAEYLLSNYKYNKTVTAPQFAEIIVEHAADNIFIANLRGNLTRGIQPLLSIARDAEALKCLLENPTIVALFTDSEQVTLYLTHYPQNFIQSWWENVKAIVAKFSYLDIARLIKEHGAWSVTYVLQVSKTISTISKNIFFTATSTADPNAPEAIDLLLNTNELYKELTLVQQMRLRLLNIDENVTFSGSFKEAVCQLAKDSEDAALALVKNSKIKHLLNEEQVINLLFQYGQKETFCTNFIPELEKNFATLASLANKNKAQVNKLFNCSKPVVQSIPVIDRYTSALKYESAFIATHLPRILINKDKDIFDEKLNQENKALFTKLTVEDLKKVILNNPTDENFARSLLFSLERADQSITLLLRQDQQFASALYDIPNNQFLRLIPSSERIEIAVNHGDQFINKHHHALIEAAEADDVAAAELIMVDKFREQISQAITPPVRNNTAAMQACREVATLMNALEQKEDKQTQSNEDTKKKRQRRI